MRERPILFSGPMVRALLAGTKTQTRRVMKLPRGAAACACDHPRWRAEADGWCCGTCAGGVRLTAKSTANTRCPYGVPGDVLWVREAWSVEWSWRNEKPRDIIPCAPIWYWADGNPTDRDYTKPKPSIHMPRWACRLRLRITDVRVERLNDISEADALAEGIERIRFPEAGDWGWPQRKYRDLWEHINGAGSWALNPFVWVVAFEVVR